MRALTGGRVLASPKSDPIQNGIVLIDQGKIIKVGHAGEVSVPSEAEKIDCTGLTITSGFQNSHVHLMGNFKNHSREKIAEVLRDSFTQYGFTTIVDTGSDPRETMALRSRIESGEIPGPRIFTAGSPLYPVDGIPFYLDFSTEIRKLIPQPSNPAYAREIVRQSIAGGSDIIKLFTGSLVDRRTVKPMDEEVARAAVDEAHRAGKLVFTHPSNFEGIKVAINSGVDVLAHTASEEGEWSQEFVNEMLSHKLSLIPTLKLWLYEAAKVGASKEDAEAFEGGCAKQLYAYYESGGRIIFGTDAGYMTDYNPEQEYLLMEKSGMVPPAILESLTAAPAALFKEAGSRGKVASGMDADLVVLEGDPMENASNFAQVVYTIRNGRTIYSR
jgi:imidazolonepropionase-like amidohydrolase